MNDWVISIGTGRNQAPLILAAQNAGYRVLGVDREPNLNLVDDALTISTHDATQIVAALAEYPRSRRFRAVLARTSGPAVQSAALAAHSLGLPGFGADFAKASLSKASLREAAVIGNVPSVGGRCVRKQPAWIAGADWVIKPDQPLYGKRNVYRVSSEEQIGPAFAAAAEESANGLVECQSYHEGRDLGLVMALSRGHVKWHFLYEEFVSEQDGRFKGRGVAGPVKHVDPRIYRDMRESAERLSAFWGSTGFAFFSFRLPASGPALLYEANPGLCGDGLADRLFPSLWSGINFFELELILMTGGEFAPLPPPSNSATLLDGQLLVGEALVGVAFDE